MELYFTVNGNWGALQADAKSGNVTAHEDSPSATDNPGMNYREITRFDVEEWQKQYPGAEIAGQTIDILDIGFWEGEDYCAPEDDYRAEIRYNAPGLIAEKLGLTGDIYAMLLGNWSDYDEMFIDLEMDSHDLKHSDIITAIWTDGRVYAFDLSK